VFVNDADSQLQFKEEIAEKCSLENFDFDSSLDPNSNYNKLHDEITTALKKYLPIKVVKYHKHKHKKSKWITQGIIRSIKYRDRLYADLQMTDPDNISYNDKKSNLNAYNRILKQNIRIAKKMYYHSLFEKYKDDVKKTWSAINGILNRSKKKRDFPKHFLIHGQYASDPKFISNEFNKFFVNIGSSLSDSLIVPQNRSFEEYLTTPCSQNFEFTCVNKEVIEKIIDNLKPKTSTGVDGMSNKLLKFVKYEISDCLTKIINQVLLNGIFPEKLKLAKVVPLYKKDKNYIFDNYRPISILPSMSKIFERVMHTQIQEYFDKNNLFFNSQYGFRPDHSTELAALEVIDQILTQMDHNRIPINLYLDLSKAFDCLDHKILLSKLQYYGFTGVSLSLMKSYLQNRKQLVKFNETDSDYMLIRTGVPQGSILGPLMFLIYVNDLPNATGCFRPVIYADDTTLGACLSNFGDNNTIIEQNINCELDKVSTWIKVNKLTLNVMKTKAMIYHTVQRNINKPRILLDGHVVEYVDEFNYLGIVIDKHVTWKKHIDLISQKISRISGLINKLKHFFPQNTLLTLYNTLVGPYLNYGVLLWGCRAGKLERLQKKLVRNITSSKYNAHSEPLFQNFLF
jgi:hypothetical protein